MNISLKKNIIRLDIQFVFGNKGVKNEKDRDFKKEFFDDVKDHVQTELNEELIAKRREIMLTDKGF